jgi:thiol-disulfide isomerase/thioredoxin
MFRISEQNRRICLPFFLLLALASIPSHPLAGQSRVKGVMDLDGHAVDPFQRAAGKIVVLLFIRTDCPISNRYAPTIQEMSAHFGKHAQFFLVYPVDSESSAQIRKHLKDFGYTLPALRDPDRDLVRASQVTITPESAVFAANGQLLYHGRIDDWYAEFGRARPAPTTHELSSTLEAAIAGKPAPVATAPAVGCYLPDAP